MKRVSLPFRWKRSLPPHLGLAWLISCFGCATALAQAPQPTDTIRLAPVILLDTVSGDNSAFPVDRRRLGKVITRNMSEELLDAERLMSEDHFQEAVDLLLPLWDKQTQVTADDPIGSTLRRAYRGLKDYQGVQRVLQRQLAATNAEPFLLSELANLYFDSGQADSAQATLDRLIKFDPKDPQRHHLAADVYLRAGRTNEGMEVYRKARVALGDSVAFSEELARILEARREYAGAVSEYFRWLDAKPESRRTVQKQITSLIKIPEAAPQITAALRGIVIARPSHEYAHRLYGDLLMESGLTDSAFAEYRRADHLSDQPGGHRWFGIQRCLETGHYQVARDEAVAFLKDYPSYPEATQVHFALAKAELSLGHVAVAVGMLKALAAQMSNPNERAHVEFQIGDVYRTHTSDMDSAAAYFQKVVDAAGHPADKPTALIRLGEIALFHGNLPGADSAYQRASQEATALPQKEEAAYHQAELSFLSGSYDTCATRLKNLVRQFPRGFYVNDALEMSIILKENKDPMNWSLKRYSAGLLAIKRRMPDTALACFGQLAADSANSLADDAQLAIGRLYSDEAEYPQAVSAYRSLIARFPGSFLVPRVWAKLGDLYSGPLADPAQAKTAYQIILRDFKDSPLVEEARAHLQALPVP
ncbi:MAG: tetratricopeptide repeat protein [candidate division Zixibacteria bacterium]|nr:tetratricopeptide repeat protein [candidate division Zixibacteria bacterium]